MSAVIDPKERRRDYVEVHERIARLEVIASDTRDDVKQLSAYLREELPQIDTRLQSLEGFRRWLSGAALAVSFIGGCLAWTWEHLRGLVAKP